MGPRSVLVRTAAAAALLFCPVSPVSPAAAGAAAAQEPPPGRAFAPRCGDPGAGRFPVEAALRGDGAALRAGGEQGGLTLRLHNASGGSCRDVHPVAVLGHGGRGRLRPADIRLEFHDAQARRWRRVDFERTSADESAGVFAGGFRGFVLRAGESREVPVRIGFAEGAPRGRVTLNVTTVQRRGDDGEWVGQSKDYGMRVEPGRRCCGGTAEPERSAAPGEEATPRHPEPSGGGGGGPGRPTGPEHGGAPGAPGAPESAGGPEGPEGSEGPRVPGNTGSPRASATPASPRTSAAPGAPEAPGTPGTRPPAPGTPAVPGPERPPAPERRPGPERPPGPPLRPGTVPLWPGDVPQRPPLLPDAAPMPESLAATGPRAAVAAGAGAAGSLLLGTALLLAARHLRRTTRPPAPDGPAATGQQDHPSPAPPG
ncbi:hypothetical protein ACXZ65_08345 [Streptomyces aculeolatus]